MKQQMLLVKSSLTYPVRYVDDYYDIHEYAVGLFTYNSRHFVHCLERCDLSLSCCSGQAYMMVLQLCKKKVKTGYSY